MGRADPHAHHGRRGLGRTTSRRSSRRALFVPSLLIMSAVSSSIVVMFYMHLKYDHKLFRALFTGPLSSPSLTLIALLFLFGQLVDQARIVAMLVAGAAPSHAARGIELVAVVTVHPSTVVGLAALGALYLLARAHAPSRRHADARASRSASSPALARDVRLAQRPDPRPERLTISSARTWCSTCCSRCVDAAAAASRACRAGCCGRCSRDRVVARGRAVPHARRSRAS